MTEREMFEKSFQRPSNYFKLDAGIQWSIDAELGILDWEGSDLSKEDMIRFWNHYKGSKMKTKSYSVVEAVLEKLKDLVKSKEILGLVIKTSVHLAFDKQIVNEDELRSMFNDAVKSYKK